jgi:acyl carrier protein
MLALSYLTMGENEIMSSKDTAREIIAIIADVSGFEVEEIKPDTNIMQDLEVDSIKTIEITVAIEKKFKISVRDEDVPKIATVKDAIDLVQKLLHQKSNTHA